MKKILTAALALSLLLSVSTLALADGSKVHHHKLAKKDKSQQHIGSFKPGKSTVKQ